MSFQVVHVRLADAATGMPTPVRIRFATTDGHYFPPLGRFADFPTGRGESVGGSLFLGGKKYAYIDGTCEIELPSGVPIDIEASKGPAYCPLRQTATLGAGQLTLRLAIEKFLDVERSIDMRCHFLAPESAALEAAAEGIDMVQLLATVTDTPSQDGHVYRTIPNLMAFSGQGEAVSGVRVNTLNVHPTLGKLALLHAHRPIFPLTYGHLDETDDWSLLDWCDQCHRKRGLVVWCDAAKPESSLPGGEALVAATLGRIDAIEFDGRSRSASFLAYCYRLWNAGIRLPLVGSSGKDGNRKALGSMRTLHPGHGPLAWLDDIRGGRTTVSSGPSLRCHVKDGIAVSEVESLSPFDRLELVVDGEVIASIAAVEGEIHRASLRHALPSDAGWVAARCWGIAPSTIYHPMATFAHTSAITLKDRPRQVAACIALAEQAAAVREWLATAARFDKPHRREQRLAACDQAIALLADH